MGLGLLHSILVLVYNSTWMSINHLQGVALDTSNGIKTIVDTNLWLVVTVITGLSFLSGALLGDKTGEKPFGYHLDSSLH